MIPLLFSDYGYFKNYNFVRLMRNWNKYMEYEGEISDDMIAEWEETLLKDFLDGAIDWLDKNHESMIWKVGLE